MTHPNVFRALGVLSEYIEKHGDSRIATAANADDVLNAFDAMRANLREEAYRTVLENKQRLFSALREVNTSFGLVINSMAALGQDTGVMQKLQRTIVKITADLSFTGEDDANNDGIRDSAETTKPDGTADLNLDLDAASRQADELFRGISNNGATQPVAGNPATNVADMTKTADPGGFVDDLDTGDNDTELPGSGGMADDLDDKKSLDQAYEEASTPQEGADTPEGDDAASDGEEDPFADVSGDDDTGSPFDGTSNEGGSGTPAGGQQVADSAPSDEELDNLFANEFPAKKPVPAAPQAPATTPGVAHSSVEITSYDGISRIKQRPLLMATAADGSIAFYAPVDTYLAGDAEAVAGILSSVKQARGSSAVTNSFRRLLTEGNLREVYRP